MMRIECDQWELPLWCRRLCNTPSPDKICALPLLAMPQGDRQRLLCQRLCPARGVPLDARRGSRKALRSSASTQLRNSVLQLLRRAGAARNPKRARDHHSRGLARRRPASSRRSTFIGARAPSGRPQIAKFPNRIERAVRRVTSKLASFRKIHIPQTISDGIIRKPHARSDTRYAHCPNRASEI
jgi:hypothetical protein